MKNQSHVFEHIFQYMMKQKPILLFSISLQIHVLFSFCSYLLMSWFTGSLHRKALSSTPHHNKTLSTYINGWYLQNISTVYFELKSNIYISNDLQRIGLSYFSHMSNFSTYRLSKGVTFVYRRQGDGIYANCTPNIKTVLRLFYKVSNVYFQLAKQ